MVRRPPVATRTYTLCPTTALFLSVVVRRRRALLEQHVALRQGPLVRLARYRRAFLRLQPVEQRHSLEHRHPGGNIHASPPAVTARSLAVLREIGRAHV